MKTIPVLLALLLALPMMAGCLENDDPAPPTQVAAKVNSQEITVHQINFVLSQRHNVTDAESSKVKGEILEQLIDQHLAKQKAVENELDRSPVVLQAIEAAKSEILARAYIERLASSVPMPAEWEIEKYYSEHPELFAERRIFDLEELLVEGPVGDELRTQLSKSKSLHEAAESLQSLGIKYVARRGVQPAEQIPLVNLPKLRSMKEGELAVLEGGDGHFQIIKLLSSEQDPVPQATAAPRIQRFLVNQRSKEYVAKQMRKAREEARIEYLGEFVTHTPREP
jgi:EpsD family peptidyl-prolyl cis-trans isomerase